jgi:hypothetical protein
MTGCPKNSIRSSRIQSNSSLSVVLRPIDSIKLNDENPRLHSDKQIRQIAKSIESFGFNVPILLDSKLRALAGHGRVLSARLLGLTEVPTILLENLTEAQAKAFVIADNKLTENATWDNRLLAEQLKSLTEAELEFSLDATGFEVGEIDILIEGVTPSSRSVDPADAPPELGAGIQISRSGDLWLLGPHRILCGDPLDHAFFSALMGNKKAAMVFTDLPHKLPNGRYADGPDTIQHSYKTPNWKDSEVELTDFFAQVCALLATHSDRGSLHFLSMDWRHMCELATAGKRVYSELQDVCVWVKDRVQRGCAYPDQYELVFVFKHGDEPQRNTVQPAQCGRLRRNVWNYPEVNFSRSTKKGKRLGFDPIAKPVALLADVFRDCSSQGDIILDPFLRIGTTVIAAERTGRVCFAMEVDPAYADSTIRRWQAFTRQPAIHAVSGRSFAELEEEVVHEFKP